MSARPASDPTDGHDCPASNCIIATEVRDELRELNAKVQTLQTSIVGNEAVGHRGIVSRLNIVERVLLILAGFTVLIGGERILKLLF
jgi:hypothetical protein